MAWLVDPKSYNDVYPASKKAIRNSLVRMARCLFLICWTYIGLYWQDMYKMTNQNQLFQEGQTRWDRYVLRIVAVALVPFVVGFSITLLFGPKTNIIVTIFSAVFLLYGLALICVAGYCECKLLLRKRAPLACTRLLTRHPPCTQRPPRRCA